MIHRYPRYGELYDAWQAQQSARRRAALFRRAGIPRSAGALATGLVRRGVPAQDDPEVRELIAKGRNFTLGGPGADGAKSSGRSWARCFRRTSGWRLRDRSRSRPRRSTIPFCRCCAIPISPASRIPACRCRRASAIRRTRASNCEMARRVHRAGVRRGAGGAVAFGGFRLRRSLSRSRRRRASTGRRRTAACWPARWARDRRGRDLPAVSLASSRRKQLRDAFRDHFLSDLIGFVYSRHGRARGGRRFSAPHPRELPAASWPSGRDALVPIILDGENAWEYYDHNGRPFLRELYRPISRGRRHDGDHGERGAGQTRSRTARITFSRAPGSAPISTSGSAPRRTTRPGHTFCARAQLYDAAVDVAEPRTEAAGVRGTADRRRQRLVLVVRPGARLGQPHRVRSALSQPPGQRLPVPGA